LTVFLKHAKLKEDMISKIIRCFVWVIFFLVLSSFTVSVNAQTSSPTSTPTNTPTHTPTPTTSNSAPYCASLTSDITTANGTPQSVTLTCAGVDPGGLIMAAEFVFGDGTSQIVEKNVGSPGSISVVHTYTTIGTLGVTCRVRDNDNVFSPAVDACKKIITIKPGASPTATATKSPTTTLAATPTNTPIATVTAELTPTPTANLYPTPIEETLVESNTGSSSIWWILAGAVSLIMAFLLLRRRRPRIPTHNTPLQTQPIEHTPPPTPSSETPSTPTPPVA
jgi:LPXTG-motif cell wall-anchored protein